MHKIIKQDQISSKLAKCTKKLTTLNNEKTKTEWKRIEF